MRRLALAAVLLLALGAGAWVWFGRAPARPAIVTPQMSAHEAVSRSVDARIGRLIHDRAPSARPTGSKLIALTFDDGPFPVETPLLLDVLSELKVPATFFLIGRDAREYPELTARIVRDGHEVGNHTFTHPNLDQIPPREVQRELSEAADAIYPLTHDPAVRKYMRPPHGRITEDGIRAAQAAGYSVVFWNEDPADERTSDPQVIAGRIEHGATQPDIVLLHAGHMATIEMLRPIVERFHSAGYRFVTVSQLLAAMPMPVVQHPLRQAI